MGGVSCRTKPTLRDGAQRPCRRVCAAHTVAFGAADSIFAPDDPHALECPLIRSVLTLRAAPGQSDAVEKFYADYAILERARNFDGCRDAVLLRCTEGSSATHLVIADWDAAADYHRWVDDPWRADVSRQLAGLLDTESDEPVVGGLFEFVPPGD